MKTVFYFCFVAFLAPRGVATAAANPPPTEQTIRPTPAPSEEFRSFIGKVRIDGVFEGNPRRILVGKDVTRVGQFVPRVLLIRLVAVDLEGKIAASQDPSGARISEYTRVNPPAHFIPISRQPHQTFITS